MPTRKRLSIKSRHGYTLIAELHIPDGDGPFPVVLFAHGYGSSKESKKTVLVTQALEDRYVCLRFDFSGHGESGGDFNGTTVTRCAEDVEDIIAYLNKSMMPQLDPQRLVLYGSSLGGAVSTVIASRHPEVKTLLLFAPVSDFASQEKACGDARNKGRESILVKFRRYGKILIRCELAEDGARHDFYSLAEKIQCPVLIFHGDKDEVIPLEHSRRLKNTLKNARLQIVHGADHIFNDDMELCAKLAEQCRKFLDAHLGEPA